jgi:hypothetical protein
MLPFTSGPRARRHGPRLLSPDLSAGHPPGLVLFSPTNRAAAEGSLLRPPLGPRAQMGGAHHDQFELYRKSFEVEPVRNDSLVAIGERLDAKGVSLKVLEQAIDTSTPTGRLMFNMLGAIAQFERELMLERQREGVAKAKAEGKYTAAPTARAKAVEVRRLHSERIGPTEIAKRLQISRASVYRVLDARTSKLLPLLRRT